MLTSCAYQNATIICTCVFIILVNCARTFLHLDFHEQTTVMQ